MPSATSQFLVSHLRGPQALCSPPSICLPFTWLTLTHLVSLDPLPWEALLVRYITGVWSHHIPPHEGRGHSAHSPQPKGWGNLLGGHLKAAGQDSKAREETVVRSRVSEQTSVGWTFPESRAPLKARSVKDPPAMQFDSWVGKIRWRRDRLPTPVFLGFPGGSADKESTCNAEDLGSIPGLGRSPGEGKGYPLQDSGLENGIVFHCIPLYSPWGRKESDATE